MLLVAHFTIVKIRWTPKGWLKPDPTSYKRDADISQHLFYGVVRVTKLEPDYKNNLPYKTNVVNLVWLLGEYTEDYFNMKIVLEKCV